MTHFYGIKTGLPQYSPQVAEMNGCGIVLAPAAMMNEIYPGQSFIDQIALFISQLEVIEEEYWWWFKSRHGKSDDQDCDRLTNHVELDFFDYNYLIFIFDEHSELPLSIRKRCLDAYSQIFKI